MPAAKPPAPPPITLTFPSTTVQPGQEETQCVVMQLGNAAPLPSTGARVCFHTSRIGGVGGGDICCPGDALCAFATDPSQR